MVSLLKSRKLLLGSASKPRSWVLNQIGLPFEVRVSNSFEKNPLPRDSIDQDAAEHIVLENASQKLNNVLNNLSEEDKQKFFGILCFDTAIWLPPDNYISKPSSKDKHIIQPFHLSKPITQPWFNPQDKPVGAPVGKPLDRCQQVFSISEASSPVD